MLKLEMGKKYKDRNGQEWEIIYISDKEIMYPVVAMYTHDYGAIEPKTHMLNGKFVSVDHKLDYDYSEYDLIEEVK
jgi:hypothetical protein